MTGKGNKTASYKIIKSEFGNIYQFFCDISGARNWQTAPYNENEPDKELMLAWESEAKEHFNLCHKCGKWVMDVMYNPEVFNCVMCSPFEDIPDYCPKCGGRIKESSTFCPVCGTRLMYGGEQDEDN